MRELSAVRLTEGETFYPHIYIFAHSAEIAVDIQITDSQNRQIHGLQLFRTGSILFCLLCSIMPTAV